jgi:hypothetical protein
MQKQDKKRHPKQAANEDAVRHPVPPSTADVPANAGKRPDSSDAPLARPKVRMQRRPFSDN